MKLIKPKVLRGFGGRGGIEFGPLVFGDVRLLCRTGDGTKLVFDESIWESHSP